jgi:Arylsulfotransferase (ASST)
MNSLDPQSNGTVVISSRHTHAVFDIDESTGAIDWELGGTHSSFTMGPGASFALQHDAKLQSPTTISIFDDEDAGPTGASVPATSPDAPARAILLRLNFTTHTATLVRALTHNGLLVRAQGNQQILANGNVVVGWGSGGVTSVFSPSGTLIFDATFGTTINSYRAYLLPWTGTPTTTPSIAATSAGGQTHVYASWNGSTQTTRWKVLGGSASSSLSVLATVSRSGFQTAITLSTSPRYVQGVALNAAGRTIGTSAVISPTAATTPGVVQTP